MARPREFDETVALDAAAAYFWAHGYASTSVRDLADVMGINGASLYNAFGDKKSLYRRALEHYLRSSVWERTRRLERSLSAKEAVHAFFNEIIEISIKDPESRGCMLVNAAFELGSHESEFRDLVVEEMGHIREFFKRCIVASQIAGDAPMEVDPEDLSRMFLSVLLGIRVLARTKPDRKSLKGIVRPALAMLDISP